MYKELLIICLREPTSGRMAEAEVKSAETGPPLPASCRLRIGPNVKQKS